MKPSDAVLLLSPRGLAPKLVDACPNTLGSRILCEKKGCGISKSSFNGHRPRVAELLQERVLQGLTQGASRRNHHTGSSNGKHSPKPMGTGLEFSGPRSTFSGLA